MRIEIRPFHPTSAAEEEWQALNRLENLRENEILPDDPPVPLVYTKAFWSSIPPIVRVAAWLALDPQGEPAGFATCELLDVEENRHMANGRIFVTPAFRRQGIGARLLAEVTRRSLEDGRRLYMSEVSDRAPSGLEFARWVGAEVGLAAHVNQLDMANLDRSLVQGWQERAAERAADYELLFWDGPYPEEALESMCMMMDSMNDAPKGDLDMEDFHWTPELLRQVESMLEGRGSQRWTLVACSRLTGEPAGYTEITWPPFKPNVGYQGATGVLNAFRNLGLGRWLKAAMLQKVLDERPQVQFIRTGNADTNAPMLNINQQLGFRPYMSNSICQVDLQTLAETLQQKGYPVND